MNREKIYIKSYHDVQLKVQEDHLLFCLYLSHHLRSYLIHLSHSLFFFSHSFITFLCVLLYLYSSQLPTHFSFFISLHIFLLLSLHPFWAEKSWQYFNQMVLNPGPGRPRNLHILVVSLLYHLLQFRKECKLPN